MIRSGAVNRLLALVVGYGWGAACLRVSAAGAAWLGEATDWLAVTLIVVPLLAAAPAGEIAVIRAVRPTAARWSVAIVLLGVVAGLATFGLEVWAGDIVLELLTGVPLLCVEVLSWAAIGLAGGMVCARAWGQDGRARGLVLAGSVAVASLGGWWVTSHLTSVELYWGVIALATLPVTVAITVVWLWSCADSR